jgi:DNA-binding MarR family transcriptional regulator
VSDAELEQLEPTLIALLDQTVPRYLRALRDAISDAEGPDRLTMPQLRCLQAIAAAGESPITTSQLAELMRVSVPTMSSMLDGFVSRGLVERHPDPASRRRLHLRITADGSEVLVRYQRIMDERHRELIRQIDTEGRARLLNALEDLRLGLDSAERQARESAQVIKPNENGSS